METEIFYFSGTGNTLYMAKRIGEKLGDVKLTDIASLDLSKTVTSQAKRVGVFFPVYFLNIPDIVRQFIKKLQIPNLSYFFMLDNFGGTEGNVIDLMKKLITRKGIHLSAAFHFVMPDNSIVFATPKEKHPGFFQTFEEKVEWVAGLIHDEKEHFEKDGSPMWTPIGHVVRKYCTNILGFQKLNVDKDRCNGCGTCQKLCPVEIIKVEKYPEWKEQRDCTMCFSCLHYCPKKAIQYKKQKDKEHYQLVNPHIKLTEMFRNP